MQRREEEEGTWGERVVVMPQGASLVTSEQRATISPETREMKQKD